MSKRSRHAFRRRDQSDEWAPDALSWIEHRRAVFSGDNQVGLLRGGDQLFPAMCSAIDAARDSVWLATYIFHDDEAAQGLIRSLVGAAGRGVAVRVVVDGFGSKATLPTLARQLQDSGVDLAVFSPVGRWWDSFKPASLRRLHQKLCVVDGRVAFVGGINVLGDRLDLRHGVLEAPRLDFAVRVDGPVVKPIEYTARGVWWRARFGREWRSELADVARSDRPVKRARKLIRQASRKPLDSTLDRTPKATQRHAGILAPVRAAFVVRDNLQQRRTIERSYIEAIRHATSKVDIVCPYFYPGRAFRRVLEKAAQRGVRVRLLLQGQFDYKIAGVAASVLYDELMAGGVQIYEYTPAFLHAKVALVDASWATVGSSNIDPLSLLLNLEANVVIEDADFVASLAAEIDGAIALSRRVGQAQLHGAGWTARLQRGFVAWCARAYLRMAGAAVTNY